MKRGVSALVLLVLLVGACGGDDDSGDIAWLNQARAEGVDVPVEWDQDIEDSVDEMCGTMSNADVGILVALQRFVADLPYDDDDSDALGIDDMSRLLQLGVDARCAQFSTETDQQLEVLRSAQDDPEPPDVTETVETANPTESVDFVEQARAEGIPLEDGVRARSIIREVCAEMERGLSFQEAQIEVFVKYYENDRAPRLNLSQEGRVFQLGMYEMCPEQAARAGG